MKGTRWEIIAAAVIIAVAVYLKPAPEQPRYAISTGQWGLFRADTRTGEIATCTAKGCKTLVPGEIRTKAELDRLMMGPISDAERNATP